MHSIRHWTPRYLIHRSQEKLYRHRHPRAAWLTPTANEILHSLLRKEDHGLEFGSGNSSVWFAQRVARLDSVEHQPQWYEKVQGMLSEAGLTNVQSHLHLRDADDNPDGSGYVRVADKFCAQSLDFVLVDGIYREYCARAVLEKIKPGGMLIIDNINLYLPCDSVAPHSVPREGLPRNAVWAEVQQALQSWRVIWTTNGISDTAIFFKPCLTHRSE